MARDKCVQTLQKETDDMFDHHHRPMHEARGRRREFDRGPRRGGFGFGMPPFMGFGFGRGPAVRRGDVRSGVLALLREQPMHGYQIIQELSERSGGIWRPSAGSIYPTLQQLEDEGLVRGVERDGRRVFELTDQGKAEAEANARPGREPWKLEGAADASDFRKALALLMKASLQVAQAGSPEAVAEARRILNEARRSMYRLLAEDEVEPDDRPDDRSTV